MPSPLSQYFTGIGAKRLSDVEVAPDVSNQHEFNGISGFREIFGSERINFQGHFIYLTDDEEQIIKESGTLTWYDARENHPSRTEYRLYYSTNPVIDIAVAGDLVVIGQTGENKLAVIVAPQGSTSEQQLLWLFGLEEAGSKFVIRDFTGADTQLNFAGQYIITSLGFEVPDTAPDFLEQLINLFGVGFPTTAQFSAYARSTLTDVSPIEEPDDTLMAWLEREELLFKTLEKHIVAKKLQQGFGAQGTDVDEFISFSLSVQNRRKSRAGFAFENHLAHIFDASGIQYAKGAKTERNNKPDFLFPGIDHYHNADFTAQLLTMLGVKTSAKERWRQVLAEADRINNKHLITLEPAISRNQTDEMIAQNLQLVLPQPLMETYTEEQRAHLITLSDFIDVVREKQQQI
ncbi:MAG: restriction endonuclease [Flavobacteriales bacterium]|nr:hypothetical protein [Flavobacteriales bacterium]MCB9448390.1 restriction endonuclease [Flavobacteriales bacterium]